MATATNLGSPAGIQMMTPAASKKRKDRGEEDNISHVSDLFASPGIHSTSSNTPLSGRLVTRAKLDQARKNDEFGKITKKLKETNEERDQLQAQLNIQQIEVLGAQIAAIDSLKEARTLLEQNLTRAHVECTGLIQRLATIQGRQDQVTNLKHEVTQLQTLLTQKQTTLQGLTDALPEAEAGQTELLETLEEQKNQIQQLQTEFTETQGPQLTGLKERITALEALPRERTWQDTVHDAAKIGGTLLVGGAIAAYGAYMQSQAFTGSLD